MHFRYILITGLMVGAAVFLPDNAFAEKNELSGQQHSQNASVQANISVKTDNRAVQTNVPAKAENTKSLKNTAVIPEPAVKNQARGKQTASNNSIQRAASQKSAAAARELPEQAKGNMQSALKKAEKADKTPESEKAAARQENHKGLGKNKPAPKNEAGDSDSLPNTIIEVKNKVQSAGLVKGFEPNLSISKKEDSFELIVPESRKQGQVPASQGEIPKMSLEINPTQRTNSSGGQSNDRISSGISTISLMDKWFEWNKYYEIKLVQPYLSRDAFLNNQWVNAPPAPPPQEAPFL
ncbi:hypothetical protein BACCIP111895_01279 [Neobacillus rhizosphaerae]|uniref:Uncharacterized protein n=1 Tax=Neobacillus rhizosphaerae TaxID=2880965 RepID=A0ABN8KPE9_9BACI|nr:hypothetical protein [Neobacillus rhizosphaerae]CAH2714125.1 hypothetical protein BACCIP111895_01279 [Neobacillus rhizosphaerae]